LGFDLLLDILNEKDLLHPEHFSDYPRVPKNLQGKNSLTNELNIEFYHNEFGNLRFLQLRTLQYRRLRLEGEEHLILIKEICMELTEIHE
jgi:hypothetical protein